MANRTMTLEEVMDELAKSRSRGEYAAAIQKLVDSDDYARDFCEVFPAKDAEAIRNSVNQNIAKLSVEKKWPQLKVVISKDEDQTVHCVVINMDAYMEALSQSQNGNVSD